MKLKIDMRGMKFTVGLAPRPKLDSNGVQRRDKLTGAEQFVTQLIGMDEHGAEAFNCTTSGAPPQLVQGQPVIPEGLVVFPWEQGERHGIAYRADALRVESPGKASS